MPQRSDKRIPRWLTIDVVIIALGLVIIGAGIWVGFDGHSFPIAVLTFAQAWAGKIVLMAGRYRPSSHANAHQ